MITLLTILLYVSIYVGIGSLTGIILIFTHVYEVFAKTPKSAWYTCMILWPVLVAIGVAGLIVYGILRFVLWLGERDQT